MAGWVERYLEPGERAAVQLGAVMLGDLGIGKTSRAPTVSRSHARAAAAADGRNNFSSVPYSVERTVGKKKRKIHFMLLIKL